MFSTKLGALILNAAMLDDVFSLILLGILSSLSSFISDDTPSEGVDNTTIVLIPPLASPHSQVLNSTNTTTPLPPEAGTIAWTVIRPVLSSVGVRSVIYTFTRLSSVVCSVLHIFSPFVPFQSSDAAAWNSHALSSS